MTVGLRRPRRSCPATTGDPLPSPQRERPASLPIDQPTSRTGTSHCLRRHRELLPHVVGAIAQNHRPCDAKPAGLILQVQSPPPFRESAPTAAMAPGWTLSSTIFGAATIFIPEGGQNTPIAQQKNEGDWLGRHCAVGDRVGELRPMHVIGGGHSNSSRRTALAHREAIAADLRSGSAWLGSEIDRRVLSHTRAAQGRERPERPRPSRVRMLIRRTYEAGADSAGSPDGLP